MLKVNPLETSHTPGRYLVQIHQPPESVSMALQLKQCVLDNDDSTWCDTILTVYPVDMGRHLGSEERWGGKG